MLRLVLRSAAALVLAAIASWLLLLRGPLEQLGEARDRQSRLQLEYVERQRYRVNLPLLRAQIPVMKDLDNAARMALPDFDGIAAGPRDIEAAIRALAKEKQLTSRLEFSTTDWSSTEFYYYRPFTVRVTGDFRRIVEFLQAFSSASVEVRGVKSALLQKVPGSDEIALSLEAQAYRFRDDEAIVNERKARTGK